jgi:hypothetical protein
MSSLCVSLCTVLGDVLLLLLLCWAVLLLTSFLWSQLKPGPSWLVISASPLFPLVVFFVVVVVVIVSALILCSRRADQAFLIPSAC